MNEEIEKQEAEDIHAMLQMQKKEWLKLLAEATMFILTIVGVSVAFDRRVTVIESASLAHEKSIMELKTIMQDLAKTQGVMASNQAVVLKLVELIEKRHEKEDERRR